MRDPQDPPSTSIKANDKAPSKLRIPVEVWEKVRELVEESSLPLAEIAKRMGIPASSISSKISRERWQRKWQVAQELANAGEPDRARLIGRLYTAFEKQMSLLEQRLKTLSGDPQAATSDLDAAAKSITSLAKTLDILLDLQNNHGSTEEEEGADDLRDQLAHRLENLCSPEEADAVSGGADTSGIEISTP